MITYLGFLDSAITNSAVSIYFRNKQGAKVITKAWQGSVAAGNKYYYDFWNINDTRQEVGLT